MLSDLYGFLSSQEELADIKIYPHHIPQSHDIASGACITFQQISKRVWTDINGGIKPIGTFQIRVQIDIWSMSLQEVDELADTIYSLLDGYSTTMGSTKIDMIYLDNELDLSEAKDKGSDEWYFRRAMDWMIKYKK